MVVAQRAPAIHEQFQLATVTVLQALMTVVNACCPQARSSALASMTKATTEMRMDAQWMDGRIRPIKRIRPADEVFSSLYAPCWPPAKAGRPQLGAELTAEQTAVLVGAWWARGAIAARTMLHGRLARRSRRRRNLN